MSNTEKFIQFVKGECKKHKVKFKPYKRRYIKLSDSIKCGGFFDDGTSEQFPKPVLAFAAGHKDYLELLVHEYCHMTQWLENIPLWRKANDSLLEIDLWLDGEDIENIEECINASRDLELDNEKRSVEMIKRWDLPIDTTEYTKKANAYVLFYNYMKTSRKWSLPSNSPYTNKEVLSNMSDKFDMDYEKLDLAIEQVYKEQNI